MLSIGSRGYEIWIVRAQVHTGVYVIDGEAKWLRKLGERSYILRVFEEAGGVALEVVVALRIDSRIPRFAKCAKDGAPTVLVVPARSRA